MYAAMVSSRVAIELPEEVVVRLDGAITTNEEEQTEKQKIYSPAKYGLSGSHNFPKTMVMLVSENLNLLIIH